MVQVSPEVKDTFLQETQDLVSLLKRSPKNTKLILSRLSIQKDIPRILGYIPIYRLYVSLDSLYKNLADKTISFTDNVLSLIKIGADKIEECCNIIREETPSPDDDDEEESALDGVDILHYIIYVDKALANEIFDISILTKEKNHSVLSQETSEVIEDKNIQVSTQVVNTILNAHEEMISRTYKMFNQLDDLKNIHEKTTPSSIMEIQRMLFADLQVLQNSLLLAHEKVLSFVSTEDLNLNHQDMHGFFVTANDGKYFIPSDYILDVISVDPYLYEVEQNQRYYKQYDPEDETIEPEFIPVYSLSSLFPGEKTNVQTDLDTILITQYQGQKIGMIVDVVQKFMYLVKKPLPPSFKNYAIFKGLAFDEKYDMIPILSVPEILKRFRSLRGYDVKKFEAKTKQHMYRILVVDDSETTRQIEKVILSNNNFLVDVASDGIEGLEMARDKQYDLILTDDIMPRMTGEILIDNLRHIDNYVHIPIVALSANPLESADAFVSKADFKRGDLIQTVKDMLHE